VEVRVLSLAPLQNKKIFSKPESRTREARPTDFRPQDHKFLTGGVEDIQKIEKKFLILIR
jgi:hypothetical protein